MSKNMDNIVTKFKKLIPPCFVIYVIECLVEKLREKLGCDDTCGCGKKELDS